MEKDLKILVVDDSVTDRKILSKMVSDFENVELVGTAPNGKIALSKIALKQPELVLLDVFMPDMDGIETLELIKKDYPHIDVIMISGMDRETANSTLKALGAGALDFVPKPSGTSPENSIAALRASLFRLVQMARTRKYSRQARGIFIIPEKPDKAEPLAYVPAEKESSPEPPKKIALAPPDSEISDDEPSSAILLKSPRQRTGRIDVVAIGVSTGGPNALQDVVSRLSGDFPVPILTVQHMPPMFTASLATRLNSISPITVVEGKNGQYVENGVMYIAPGGCHMVVRREKFTSRHIIGLTDSPPVNSCRPSVDVLFRSIAMSYGGNVLTVILTGMGNDGISGVTAIRRKGGYSVVQDEKTSVIWGMPGSVVAANQADEVIPIDQIGPRIMGIIKGKYS